MNKIVVDTNVLVSAFTSGNGASREVLRRILTGYVRPVISTPLFAVYEDVLSRPETHARSPLSEVEQSALFDAFIAKTQMIEVYFSWRPNLRDEGDNLVVELDRVVTRYATTSRGIEFAQPRGTTTTVWRSA